MQSMCTFTILVTTNVLCNLSHVHNTSLLLISSTYHYFGSFITDFSVCKNNFYYNCHSLSREFLVASHFSLPCRQNEKVLQHKYEVAILAEKLMAKTKALPPIRTKKPAAMPK